MLKLACLAWLGGETGAGAQVIDEYLNPNIPGYGTAAGVTVATRQHPDYDSLGVRLGDYTLTSSLDESFGYDDNVTGTPSAHGSPLIETTAHAGVTGGPRDTPITASLMVNNYAYTDQPNQDYTNWSGAAGLSHEFGLDTLSIGGTYLNLNQTSRQLDVPLLTTPIPYRVGDARISYDAELGQSSLQPSLDVSDYSYDNGTLENGQSYLQSYRDRILIAPSILYSFEFATRRRLVVILRDTKSDYDRNPPGEPRQNFNDASVLAGVSYDADGAIAFRLLAGYEERSFASSLYKFTDAPIVEGEVTWTPTELTTINATAARYIQDSSAEYTVAYTETALKLKIDHEYLRNVILSAYGNVFLDDYQKVAGSDGGSQYYFTAGVGASYALNRYARLAANYVFSTRHSSTTATPAEQNASFFEFGEEFGGNYSENRFTVTLHLAL